MSILRRSIILIILFDIFYGIAMAQETAKTETIKTKPKASFYLVNSGLYAGLHDSSTIDSSSVLGTV